MTLTAPRTGPTLLLRCAGLVATVGATSPLLSQVAAQPELIGSPRVATALLSAAVFALAFWMGTRDDESDIDIFGQARVWLGVQILASNVALLSYPHTTIAVLTVVVAAQLPALVGGRLAAAWFALQGAVLILAMQQQPVAAQLTIVGVYGSFQVFGYATMWSMERESAARRELQVSNAHLRSTRALRDEDARRTERRRIAADLHDTLGHDLVALTLNLDLLRRRAEQGEREELDRAHDVARRTLDDLRAVVRATRSVAAVDLRTELDELARGIPRPRVHVEAPESLAVPDGPAAQAALRCAQEGLTNAVRHAGAGNVWIRLQPRDGGLVIEIEDDGIGTRAAAGSRARGGGSGLDGLRARARELGGSVEFGAGTRGGTRLAMHVPVAGLRA